MARKGISSCPQRRLGAHISIAGGLHRAFERATQAGCDTLQLFVKNQRQWHAPQPDKNDVRTWQEARASAGIEPIFAHSSYLINLASPDEVLWNKSIDAFEDELVRCEELDIPYLVTHPGSHNGDSEAKGIKRVIRALNVIHRRTKDFAVRTLIETTAGQGTNLGYRFEQLAQIIHGVFNSERMGVCFDTCHAFAAGYDLTSDEGYHRTFDQIKETVALQSIQCFHLNDSYKPFGSRVDRHAGIGMGEMGAEPFRRLVNDKRFFHVPMIIETPKGQDEQGRDLDQINLAALRRLINMSP